MTVETEDELRALQEIGRIVAIARDTMLARVEPGMTTLELDLIGKQVLDDHGANSAPKVTYNFPGFTCISLNEEAAHGIPRERVIQPGDVLNVDVSAEKNGFFSDTGATLVVPPSTRPKDRLLRASEVALEEATKAARAGKPLNRIGRAIEKVARKRGFRIIKNLCSHGIGRALHEEPREIPGYFEPQDKRLLHDGLVITIETFLSTRSDSVAQATDGWTLLAQPDNLSAQFEHTMVITKGSPILLTVV